MDLITSLAILLGALTVGAMSPGPSFVLVARTAIASSRANGLAAAAGMGMGGVVFSILVLLGLQAALAGVSWLYLAFKLVGGVYLIYLGVSIWRAANQPLVITDAHPPAPSTLGRSFYTAVGAQLGNPKAAVVYGSLFAALLPRELPNFVAFAMPVFVFVIEAGWYAVVAVTLSSASPRAAYLRTKVVIDRVAGGLLSLLGIKLVISSNATA